MDQQVSKSKRQNKKLLVRRSRRALNNVVDFFVKITGKRLVHHRWGSGVGRSHILTKEDDHET